MRLQRFSMQRACCIGASSLDCEQRFNRRAAEKARPLSAPTSGDRRPPSREMERGPRSIGPTSMTRPSGRFWGGAARDQLIGGPRANLLTGSCTYPGLSQPFGRIDRIADRLFRLHFRDLLDLPRPQSVRPRMHEIELLVEKYLAAERDLVVAVDTAGGTVPLPDGRTVTVGRAEFDGLLNRQRKRAWVIIRRDAPMPPRR